MRRMMLQLVALAFIGVCAPTGADTPEDMPEETTTETEEGAAAVGAIPQSAIYLPLKPPFVVNYGGSGKLKYLKAELAVRLRDQEAVNAVRHHTPYIRNNLVMLLASQTDESLESQTGKEALRQEALREVRDILKAQEGIDGVIDIYFNDLIIQK